MTPGISFDNNDVTEITAGGSPVTEVTVDGEVVWTAAHNVIEDFEHNDLATFYQGTTFDHFTITTDQAYQGDRSLEVEASNIGGGENIFADTSQFTNVIEPGNTYIVPYWMRSTGNNNVRVRFYWATDGGTPQNDNGWRIQLRQNDEFFVERWSNGTLFTSDSTTIGTIPTNQWDWLRISYANPDEAGSDVFEVKWYVDGSVQETLSTDLGGTDLLDEWGWEHPWGWEGHYFGGIYTPVQKVDPVTVIEDFEDGSSGWEARWSRDTGSFTSSSSSPIHADSNRSLASTAGYDVIAHDDGFDKTPGNTYSALIRMPDTSDHNTMFGAQSPGDVFGGDEDRLRMRPTQGHDGRVDMVTPAGTNDVWAVIEANGQPYQQVFYHNQNYNAIRVFRYPQGDLVGGTFNTSQSYTGGSFGIRGPSSSVSGRWDRFVEIPGQDFSLGSHTVLEDHSWAGSDSVSDHYSGSTNRWQTTTTNQLTGTGAIERTGSGWPAVAHTTERVHRGNTYLARVSAASGGTVWFLFGVQDVNDALSDTYAVQIGTGTPALRRYVNGNFIAASWGDSPPMHTNGDRIDVYIEYDINNDGIVAVELRDGQNRPYVCPAMKDTTHGTGSFGIRASDNAPDAILDSVIRLDDPINAPPA